MNILRLACVGIVATLSSQALATPSSETPEKRLFKANIIIFKQWTPQAFESERWPTVRGLKYPEKITSIEHTDGLSLTAPYQALKTDETLPVIQKQLKSRSPYQILWTKSWISEVPSKQKALPVVVQGGQQYGDLYELEGYITLYLSRYLHLKTNLWLSSISEDLNLADQWWQHTPADNTALANVVPKFEPTLTNDNLAQTQDKQFHIDWSTPIQTSRKMRSGELHYIDHPLFGILIRIDKYTPPETAAHTKPIHNQEDTL